jgi:hypothetical protein
MAIEEKLLDAVLDLTKEVHSMGTKIDNKIALLIDANKLKEEEQDQRIENIEKLAPLAPFANIIKNQKFILFGMVIILGLTGLSFTQLVINTINEATGVNQLIIIEKKNSATLKRLCSYLKVVCE